MEKSIALLAINGSQKEQALEITWVDSTAVRVQQAPVSAIRGTFPALSVELSGGGMLFPK